MACCPAPRRRGRDGRCGPGRAAQTPPRPSTSIRDRRLRATTRDGSQLAPRIPDLLRLEREIGERLLQLAGISGRVHAALHQLERLDVPLELASLGEERADLRIV